MSTIYTGVWCMCIIELKQFEDYKGAMRTLHRMTGNIMYK
jgi:hypothetical protein